MELSGSILPWLASAAAVLIAYGLYLAFFVAPADYQQGETVKIMYIHVPSAWLAMMGYGFVAVSSFGLLVFRHPLADVSAKAAVPIGAAFTALALLTGSLWGKPMWGTYWVWRTCERELSAIDAERLGVFRPQIDDPIGQCGFFWHRRCID